MGEPFFRKSQIVFASCQNAKPWPAKITGVQRQNNNYYRVKFYNYNGFAVMEQHSLQKFQQNVQRYLSLCEGSKNRQEIRIFKAIKLAEKQKQKQNRLMKNKENEQRQSDQNRSEKSEEQVFLDEQIQEQNSLLPKIKQNKKRKKKKIKNFKKKIELDPISQRQSSCSQVFKKQKNVHFLSEQSNTQKKQPGYQKSNQKLTYVAQNNDESSHRFLRRRRNQQQVTSKEIKQKNCILISELLESLQQKDISKDDKDIYYDNKVASTKARSQSDNSINNYSNSTGRDSQKNQNIEFQNEIDVQEPLIGPIDIAQMQTTSSFHQTFVSQSQCSSLQDNQNNQYIEQLNENEINFQEPLIDPIDIATIQTQYSLHPISNQSKQNEIFRQYLHLNFDTDLDNREEEFQIDQGDYTKLASGISIQMQNVRTRQIQYLFSLIQKFTRILINHFSLNLPQNQNKCLLSMKRKQVFIAILSHKLPLIQICESKILDALIQFVRVYENQIQNKKKMNCLFVYNFIRAQLDSICYQILEKMTNFELVGISQSRKKHLFETLNGYLKRKLDYKPSLVR